MADGLRYTESGDIRVTENSDYRITERVTLALSSLSGEGTSSIEGVLAILGVSSLSGVGSVSVSPSLSATAQFGPIFGPGERVTATDDDRITEPGDLRVTNNIILNIGQSLLITTPSYVPFTSEMSVNVLDDWKMSFPYVKYGGEWVEPTAIYKHVNGYWKRVH